MTLTLDFPETLAIKDKEVKMYLASKLYEAGRLSLGQAANLVGYSKETFMELLSEYQVSLFGYTEDELSNDLKNVTNSIG